jgi:hypothetical protein
MKLESFRKIQLKVPISLHEEIKVIAIEAHNMTQGKATNILLALGIQKFYEMKERGEETLREPVDLESGD